MIKPLDPVFQGGDDINVTILRFSYCEEEDIKAVPNYNWRSLFA
jgi:hypothetical protein